MSNTFFQGGKKSSKEGFALLRSLSYGLKEKHNFFNVG